MRPALLIVGGVLLFLGHLEAVHNSYREGFLDAIIYQEKSPTVEMGPKDIKEIKETNI